MIIIINGSVGVGKTSISFELQKRFSKSIMLDGDQIGAVYPFELYDQTRIEHLYDTISLLVGHHLSYGYSSFVINYIFESPESLSHLISKLEKYKMEMKCFFISCTSEEQIERIELRSRTRKDWELARAKELNSILKKAELHGYIGEHIDTSGKSLIQTIDSIWRHIINSNSRE